MDIPLGTCRVTETTTEQVCEGSSWKPPAICPSSLESMVFWGAYRRDWLSRFPLGGSHVSSVVCAGVGVGAGVDVGAAVGLLVVAVDVAVAVCVAAGVAGRGVGAGDAEDAREVVQERLGVGPLGPAGRRPLLDERVGVEAGGTVVGHRHGLGGGPDVTARPSVVGARCPGM